MRKTDTARSATEQLLLSHSVDRAVGDLGLACAENRKAYMDVSFFSSVDKEYYLASIKNMLLKSGAMPTGEKEADVIIVPRVGALGTDYSEFLIGIPKIPIAIPGAGAFETPEIALFKVATQRATTKLRIFAYDSKTRKHLDTKSAFGSAVFKKYIILFIPFQRTDVPEKFWRHPHTED